MRKYRQESDCALKTINFGPNYLIIYSLFQFYSFGRQKKNNVKNNNDIFHLILDKIFF